MSFYCHKPAPLFIWPQILVNFALKLYLLVIKLAKNHVALLVVFVVTFYWGPLLNVQFQPGNRQRRPLIFVSGDVQLCSTYGYITHHWLFCLHAKYHYTKFGPTVVTNIWNVEAQQRQRYLTWAELYHIMSVSNELYDLLFSITILSQDRVTIIFTVKFKIYNIAFTLTSSFEGQSNWNID